MTAFELEKGEGDGPRAGLLRFPSGKVVKTPLFMPVATKMSVKTIDSRDLEETGSTTIITNGFLSSLEPGSSMIRDQGGMHRMMNWNGGIFSDSGGFQFIRKGFDARISEEGVDLRSPFTGDTIFLTPESVIDMHASHGVDVGMVLDHCPPFPSTREQTIDSANRTVYWARRSRIRMDDPDIEDLLPEGRKIPLYFAITQGGVHSDIRKDCTEKLAGMDFPGYGIGGLSIGESKEDTFRSLKASTSMLPSDKPRYFMGVGDPEDVVRSVLSGVDIFDSVFPTRNARHRSVFTEKGRENIRAGEWRGSVSPIMNGCECPACGNYTRGYIYHLFKAGEPLGPRLATLHNIHYLQDLVEGIRKMIFDDGIRNGMTVEDVLNA